MGLGNGVILFDASGAPVALSQGVAVPVSQPGVVTAGSDYAVSPAAQIPKVDKYGTQYVASANPAGTSAQFYSGQPSPATALQYGDLGMVRQDSPSPGQMVAITADSVGAVQTHLKSKQTFRGVASAITCAANKTLLALTNSSASTMVIRLNELNIYVPPAGAGGSGLLGISSNSVYYPVICEIRRITTASGGTTVALATTDTQDALAPGVACMASPTTVSATVSTYHRGDAYISTVSGLPFFFRQDPNQKSLVLRPGEGVAVVCVSSGQINSSTGSGTVTAAVDIVMVCTQAPG